VKKLHQNRAGVLRVVVCGLHDDPKVTLLADNKRLLCYRRWQDSKWEPIYTEDGRLYRKSLEIAEVINRL